MVTLPFIYFTILLIYIIRKKRSFDICAYIVSLYAISSFFSILIDQYDLRSIDTRGYDIGVAPAVLYCFLLTLTIWPFYRFESGKIVSIRLNRQGLFNAISYFYFACFLLIIISSFENVLQILHGDFGTMRTALNRGESILDSPVGLGIFHPIFVLANVFGAFSFVMLLFYFYSICFLNRSKNFNRMILLSSLTMVVIGILGVDRSKTIYWIIAYGFMLILFWHHMNRRQRKGVIGTSVIMLSVVTVYFLAVTFSRFGDMSSGTQGGMISYAGQSFINFCFFFDKVHYNRFSLQRIFPLFYKLFVPNGILNNNDLNTKVSSQTGVFVGVFSTFLGDIMVVSGKVAIVIYCFVYNLISRKMVSVRDKSKPYFYQILFVFCIITVPMFGVFANFYHDFPRVIALLFFLLYGYYLKVNRGMR